VGVVAIPGADKLASLFVRQHSAGIGFDITAWLLCFKDAVGGRLSLSRTRYRPDYGETICPPPVFATPTSGFDYQHDIFYYYFIVTTVLKCTVFELWA